MNVYLDAYLRHQHSKGSLQSTIATYERKISHYIRFIEDRSGAPYDQLNPLFADSVPVTAYYQEISGTQGATTRNHTVTILRAFLHFLKSQGHLTELQLSNMCNMLPFTKVRPNRLDRDAPTGKDKYSLVPLEKKPLALMDPNVIESLLACEKGYQHKRNRAIIAMFLGTGLRAQELCSLNVADFHNMRKGRILCLRKGGEQCWVDVADFVIPYIHAYLMTRKPLRDEDPLFLTKLSTRMTPINLYGVLQTRFGALGLKATTHDFRRAFLTAAEETGSPVIAKELANHKSLRTTTIYTNPSAATRRKVVNNMPWTVALTRRGGNISKQEGTGWQ